MQSVNNDVITLIVAVKRADSSLHTLWNMIVDELRAQASADAKKDHEKKVSLIEATIHHLTQKKKWHSVL